MDRIFAICVMALLLGCNSPQESSNPNLHLETELENEKPGHNLSLGPRWPKEESGHWVALDDSRLRQMKLSDFELVPTQPLPPAVNGDRGYVPVECTGPTIRAKLENQTEFEIANIRIRVRAFQKSNGELLADETTDTPGKYFSTFSGETTQRKFVLKYDGQFSDISSWPDYNLDVSVISVRATDAK